MQLRLRFQSRFINQSCFAMLFIAGMALVLNPVFADNNKTRKRRTPLVEAVENCGESVVNLRGRKTIPNDEPDASQPLKQVNGMGTGVVVDPRGYILTNYHVVEGVKRIEVTTDDQTKTVAKLVAHDPGTDLALLKIDIGKELPVIKIGTSTDLMLAETVAAVGNAYGYEHTVTVGIISQLGRTVQVNEKQVYRNLIQTDAPINPGNSGGPLLNLEGEMIGINVAVRIGAQGIAFAIPVNDAMEVAADLMSQVAKGNRFHGLTTRTIYRNDQPQLVVEEISRKSSTSDLKVGDRITAINGELVDREIDFHRALLNTDSTKQLSLKVVRNGKPVAIALSPSNQPIAKGNLAWDTVGVRVTPLDEKAMRGKHESYSRGLKIVRVRPGSSAYNVGIMEGDILVAMHGFRTESIENLAYILGKPEIQNREKFMFYIIRDKEPLKGQMRVAGALKRRK